MMVFIPFVASFSSAAVTVLAVLMIVVFLLKRILLKDFHLLRTPIQLPFLLIAIFSAFSFLKTIDIRASIQGMWKLFYYFSLLTIIIEELKDMKHARWIINATLFGLFLASIDGIWQLYAGWDFFRHHFYNVQEGIGNFPRIRAAFPHTNIFAAYLGLFIPLAIATFLYYWEKKFKRIIYLVIAISALFCLFWTFSQGAVVGFITALIFIGLLRKNKFVFIFLISLIILAPFIMPQGLKYLAKESKSIWVILLNPNRIGDFRNALNMIKHNPILGVGVNTYCLNLEKYIVKDNSIFLGSAGYVHNIFLHMAAEIGIFGLISFLWLIFRLFKHGLKKYRLEKIPFIKMYMLGVMAGLLGFLINGLTETVLYYPKVAVLFWFQVGILFGLIKINKNNSYI